MKYNFKKKYGQNFLNNNSIIDKIVGSINPDVNDLVIEIGPGIGALSKGLISKSCYYRGYEIDTEAAYYLSKLENEKAKFIYGDFLKSDIKKDIENINYKNLYVIGNLPYYITTPIITKLIDDHLDIKECVFMVQKEVADRFSAKVNTREYGSITVFLNYFFDITKVCYVGRNNFTPAPNVDSEVIKFTKKEEIPVDFEKFNKLVKHAFQFKRKNLRNNLKCYDESKIETILSEFGLSLNNRAEELDYHVFCEIANKY